MACSICCFAFTEHARLPIACPGCDATACTGCVKKYLLSTTEDPHCMSCRLPWSVDFVEGVLPRTFCHGELSKHRRDVLLGREKALLSNTLEDAARELRRREIVEQEKKVDKEIKSLREQLAEAQRLKKDLRVLSQGAGPSVHRENIVGTCPMEGCRGFVDGASWSCVLCMVQVCASCKQVDPGDGSHACRPEDIENAKFMAKETKPCPNCTIPISKVDGCDQMFCVACTTTFSWETGRIQKGGRIHNPEYFRWMRDRGMAIPRAPGDDACDPLEFPHYRTLDACLNASKDLILWSDDRSRLDACEYIKKFYWLAWAEAVRIRDRLEPPNPDPNRDLRVAYLLKDITEAQWQQKLLRREVEARKKAAIHATLEMFAMAGNDIVRRIIAGDPAAWKEIEALRVYYNQCADSLAERRIGHIPKIDESLNYNLMYM